MTTTIAIWSHYSASSSSSKPDPTKPAAQADGGQMRKRRGWTLSAPDALIAASAEAIDAAVLTRNVRDFALTQARIETY